MAIVTITGTKTDGKEFRKDLDPAKTYELKLNNLDLVSIDLSAITSCYKLKSLEIKGNPLQEIDLTPVGEKGVVDYIYIEGNAIEEIDLTPLGNIELLKSFSLKDNRLSNINLSPLQNCTRLTSLFLSGNALTAIDLNPLSSCLKLGYLFLDNNRIESINLNPLRNCRQLKRLHLQGNPIQHLEVSELDDLPLLDDLQLDTVEALPEPVRVKIAETKSVSDAISREKNRYYVIVLIMTILSIPVFYVYIVPINSLAALVIGIILFPTLWAKGEKEAARWAIVSGAIISAVTMGIGFFMATLPYASGSGAVISLGLLVVGLLGATCGSCWCIGDTVEDKHRPPSSIK